MNSKLIYGDLSYEVVGLALQVHRDLGYGFLEKVYENSLMILLEENGIKAQRQFPIRVKYLGKLVGKFRPDILVEDKIILELKSARNIDPAHKSQTLDYLKATGLKLAILLNFGKTTLERERFIM